MLPEPLVNVLSEGIFPVSVLKTVIFFLTLSPDLETGMLVLRSLCVCLGVVCLGVEVCKEAELHVDIRVSMYSYKISWNSAGGTDRLTWAHEARGGGTGSQRPGGLERIRSSLSRSEIKTRDGLRAHNRPGQSPLGWPSLQGGWSRHARHYVCPGASHTGRCRSEVLRRDVMWFQSSLGDVD